MLLFINACVRGESSRTLLLCRHFLKQYSKLNPHDEIFQINIPDMELKPLCQKELIARDELIKIGRLDDDSFVFARQFAAAKKILIGAPYWDLSFPAALKTYIERVSVNNIAFKYSEKGQEGMCKADKMLYITTSGGYIGNRDFGSEYLNGICGLFGIRQFDSIKAEGLDILGADIESILSKTAVRLEEMAEIW